MIKTVLTSAGKGTRLLPFTKEMAKEMMPIFSEISGKKSVVPLLQYIFEQLYNLGIRDYCFIVGREKRAIEDHFSPHEDYLKTVNKNYQKIMNIFYKKIHNSNVVWINQNRPLGFGDAVKRAESFVGKDDFIVHAGDVSILSHKEHPILKMINLSKKYPDAYAILICKKVKDFKRFGVPKMTKISKNIFIVNEVEEKPKKPKSDYGLLPIYYFKSEIFNCLRKTEVGKLEELQLTDGIQKLINDGKKVLAIAIDEKSDIDVGTVDSYKDALEKSFRKA
jgi:UTP--glucose-1-phosphate uridylyltransferase